MSKTMILKYAHDYGYAESLKEKNMFNEMPKKKKKTYLI